jgi:hypothetical protein
MTPESDPEPDTKTDDMDADAVDASASQAPPDRELWSLDGHYFNAGSLGDLLETFADLDVGDVVFVARPAPPQVHHYLPARAIVQQLAEQASDECGEAAEDWPQVGPDALQELDQLLQAWIDRHCPVQFWNMTDVREHLLTADDIAQARGQES